MPSNKPYIMVRTDKETIEKFKTVSEAHNRSMANMAETLIKQSITEHEKTHGKIKIEEE